MSSPSAPAREAVLLTATIAPPQGILSLGLADPQTRLIQYLCSLLSWIRATQADRIVICENSAFPFDYSGIADYAVQNGKDLEILSFRADHAKWKRSKGYGEGEILEFAMGQSRILRESDTFFKATGRLFFPDFDAAREAMREVPRAFQKHEMPGMVQTMFFKCDTEFFKKHLMHAYRKVDDLIPYFIEHAFHDALKDLPYAEGGFGRIVGRSATTGQVYDERFSEALIADAAAFLSRGLPKAMRD